MPVLLALRRRVRSGDPQNIEAQASRKCWGAYLQDVQFRRNVDGKPPSNLLNYGYMVLRAAVARALCSAGLLPCLGGCRGGCRGHIFDYDSAEKGRF